ncbi:MAG: hypothetical protein ABI597_11820 [Gammaproteobacteria bacterium]
MLPRLKIKQLSADATLYVVQLTYSTQSQLRIATNYLGNEVSKIGGEIISAEVDNEFCLVFSNAPQREDIVALINNAEKILANNNAAKNTTPQGQNNAYTESKRPAIEQKNEQHTLQIIEYLNADIFTFSVKCVPSINDAYLQEAIQNSFTIKLLQKYPESNPQVTCQEGIYIVAASGIMLSDAQAITAQVQRETFASEYPSNITRAKTRIVKRKPLDDTTRIRIATASKMRLEESNKLLNNLFSIGKNQAINQCISMPVGVELVNSQVEITLFVGVITNKKYYNPQDVRRILLTQKPNAEDNTCIQLVLDFFNELKKRFHVPTYTIESLVVDNSKIIRISYSSHEVTCELSGNEQQEHLRAAVRSSSLLKAYIGEFNLKYPDIKDNADLAIAHCLNSLFTLLKKQTFESEVRLLGIRNTNLAKALSATENFALTPLSLFEPRENKAEDSFQQTDFVAKLREILQENHLDFFGMESFSLHPLIDFILLKLGRVERMDQNVWDVKLLFLTKHEKSTFLVIEVNNESLRSTYLSFELNTAYLTALLPEFKDYLDEHYNEYMTLRSVICQHANQKTMHYLSDLIIAANFAAADNFMQTIREILIVPLVSNLPVVLVDIIYDYVFGTYNALDIIAELQPLKKALDTFNYEVNPLFTFIDKRKNIKFNIDSDALLVTVDSETVPSPDIWTRKWTQYFTKQEENKPSDSASTIENTSLMRMSGLEYSTDTKCLKMKMDYHRMFKSKTAQREQSLKSKDKNQKQMSRR